MDKATIVTYPDEFAKREIAELAVAGGYSVQALITQKRVVKSEFGVGVGKAEELREIVRQNGSNTLIIDESLTSAQAYKLATVTRVEIVDRERLILNIFAKRATTTEAKLQVQLGGAQVRDAAGAGRRALLGQRRTGGLHGDGRDPRGHEV